MDKLDIPVNEYEKFAGQFNPVKFNADEWVAIAKNAGMKYIVITSKHHEGFALGDSKVSNYDIMGASPFKRDIIKELSDACKRQGKMGNGKPQKQPLFPIIKLKSVVRSGSA